jgi:hypothetical protein
MHGAARRGAARGGAARATDDARVAPAVTVLLPPLTTSSSWCPLPRLLSRAQPGPDY